MNFTSDYTPFDFSISRSNMVIMLANAILFGTGETVDTFADAQRVWQGVYGERKIAGIKFARTMTGMSLREAKDFVEQHAFAGTANSRLDGAINAARDRSSAKYGY